MNHSLFNLVCELGLSTKNSFEVFNPKVRDNDKIKAYKCNRSGIILLDTISQGTETTYSNKQDFAYWNQAWNKGHKEVHLDKSNINEDDIRRANLLRPMVTNKKWLDFGSGMGGALRLLKDDCLTANALEIQSGPREYLAEKGIQSFSDISSLPDENYDILTLFHVFEHLPDPIITLKNLMPKLKKNATVLIEVPNANDALLSLYESSSFKDFTLWSEHLLLHTSESLKLFIEEAGLVATCIKGLQRYSLSNHLHWLSKNKPGGHMAWSFLDSKELHSAYEATLASMGRTDTLLAYCKLP